MGIVKLLYRVNFGLKICSNETIYKIVIYSEGKHQWLHFKGYIDSLSKLNQKILFMSSDDFLPKELEKDLNFDFINIGFGGFRRWIFNNINCKFFILSLPDLNRFYLKRSKFNPTYIYMPHSLVSMTAAYREKAFNDYDVIVCANQNHVKECKSIEKFYNLKFKKLIKSGYSKTSLIKIRNKQKKNKKTILIAPTWGKNGLIESEVVIDIISSLLSFSYNIILQPHFETIKRNKILISKIKKKFQNHQNFELNTNLALIRVLEISDFLITDWSGIMFEFNICAKKPIIFYSTDAKINNPNYKNYKLTPIEFTIRNEIGYEVKSISEILKTLRFAKYKSIKKKNLFDFRPSLLQEYIKKRVN